MHAIDDEFWNSKCAISAPAEAAAGRLDDEDARFVLEQASNRIETQTPHRRDLGD
jgi:hypothetical protein